MTIIIILWIGVTLIDIGAYISLWCRIKSLEIKVGTPSASHNTEREFATQILLNCTSCHWRDQCVVKLNGEVCRIKYERKTSPIS